MVALMRSGRTFCDVIVPGNCNDTSKRGCAGHIGMLKHIGTAVNTRPLAVPQPKNAIVLFLCGIKLYLLRSPHCSRGKLLINAWLKDNVMAL